MDDQTPLFEIRMRLETLDAIYESYQDSEWEAKLLHFEWGLNTQLRSLVQKYNIEGRMSVDGILVRYRRISKKTFLAVMKIQNVSSILPKLIAIFPNFNQLRFESYSHSKFHYLNFSLHHFAEFAPFLVILAFYWFLNRRISKNLLFSRDSIWRHLI